MSGYQVAVKIADYFEEAEKIAYEEGQKAAGWYLEDVLESLPAHNKVLADTTVRELTEWKQVRDKSEEYLFGR